VYLTPVTLLYTIFKKGEGCTGEIATTVTFMNASMVAVALFSVVPMAFSLSAGE
jgi:hypothetical protein